MEARLEAPDVLIVGAGVVGAALAYECARRGQRVLVVDRAESPVSERRVGAWVAHIGSPQRPMTDFAISAAKDWSATSS